jgi:hypothetical protein
LKTDEKWQDDYNSLLSALHCTSLIWIDNLQVNRPTCFDFRPIEYHSYCHEDGEQQDDNNKSFDEISVWNLHSLCWPHTKDYRNSTKRSKSPAKIWAAPLSNDKRFVPASTAIQTLAHCCSL